MLKRYVPVAKSQDFMVGDSVQRVYPDPANVGQGGFPHRNSAEKTLLQSHLVHIVIIWF